MRLTRWWASGATWAPRNAGCPPRRRAARWPPAQSRGRQEPRAGAAAGHRPGAPAARGARPWGCVLWPVLWPLLFARCVRGGDRGRRAGRRPARAVSPGSSVATPRACPTRRSVARPWSRSPRTSRTPWWRRLFWFVVAGLPGAAVYASPTPPTPLGLPHPAVAVRRPPGRPRRRRAEPRARPADRSHSCSARAGWAGLRRRPARPRRPTPAGRWRRWRCGSTCG